MASQTNRAHEIKWAENHRKQVRIGSENVGCESLAQDFCVCLPDS